MEIEDRTEKMCHLPKKLEEKIKNLEEIEKKLMEMREIREMRRIIKDD